MCGKENIWESAHFLPTTLSAPKGEFFIYLGFSLELTPTVLWISGHEKQQQGLQARKSQSRHRHEGGWSQNAEISP